MSYKRQHLTNYCLESSRRCLFDALLDLGANLTRQHQGLSSPTANRRAGPHAPTLLVARVRRGCQKVAYVNVTQWR